MTENKNRNTITPMARCRNAALCLSRIPGLSFLLVGSFLLRIFWLPPLTDSEKIAYLRKQHRLWRWVLNALSLLGCTIAYLAVVNLLSLSLAVFLMVTNQLLIFLVLPAAVLSDVDHPL